MGMHCPKCGITHHQSKAGRNRSGSHRYQCTQCGTKYSRQQHINNPPERFQHAIKLNADGINLRGALELARAAADENRTIVLVEGASDQLALNALAERRGWDLAVESITTVATGGATNFGHFLKLLEPQGLDVQLAGLCDVGEEHHVRRALERAGFGSDLTRSDMETLGFYVCNADLEDELIRSLGIDAVLEIATAQGELESFRTFQKQVAWQVRDDEAQLRRWLGVRAHRKLRYATLLVDALDLDRVPAPLDRLLTHILHIN